jgi:hypothetical protein
MGGESPFSLLRILWRIALMAFGVAGSAGIDAVTFAQVSPDAHTDRAGNDHG